MMGMIIGKVTGNYTAAVASSVLVDLDHIQSYITHGVIFKPKKLWSALTDQVDHWGDQRGVLHNVIFFALVAIFLLALAGTIGQIIVLGYAGHLLLDALDNSDYWPFYPNKRINLKGPIKYGSIQELVFFIGLVLVFFLI
jgi:membrane-bound metal-dependent hydrolase YbcI (DUF457 family)